MATFLTLGIWARVVSTILARVLGATVLDQGSGSGALLGLVPCIVIIMCSGPLLMHVRFLGGMLLLSIVTSIRPGEAG